MKDYGRYYIPPMKWTNYRDKWNNNEVKTKTKMHEIKVRWLESTSLVHKLLNATEKLVKKDVNKTNLTIEEDEKRKEDEQ